jgi:hypothetical protein
MKTDALVEMLARGPVDMPRTSFARRYGLVLAGGATLAVVAVAYALGLHPPSVMGAAWFWTKLAFVSGVLAPAAWLALRLARPGARWAGRPPPSPAVRPALDGRAVPVVRAAPGERLGMWLGSHLAELSGRHRRSVDPDVRGAALDHADHGADAVASRRGRRRFDRRRARGARLQLHCPETTAAFVGTWYVLGIAAPTLVGALIGLAFCGGDVEPGRCNRHVGATYCRS